MKIIHIVALSDQNVIGHNGAIPWHIPEDLKRFRSLTKGKPVIMGRKTFESIGKILDDRLTIIISRQPRLILPDGSVLFSGCFVEIPEIKSQVALMSCPLEALLYCRQCKEVIVAGGQEIYSQTINYTDEIYATLVSTDIEGDRFYPTLSDREWEIIEVEDHEGYSYITFTRVN